jgi:hypothetical protein
MKWSKKYSSMLLNINMLYLDANALQRGGRLCPDEIQPLQRFPPSAIEILKNR